MGEISNSFTQWAVQMIRLLEDGKLVEPRWFARVNAVLTPHNLSSCIMHHGEREVNDAVSMLFDHVRSQWRPSWNEFAGALTPSSDGWAKGRLSSSDHVGASPRIAPFRTSSSDAMDVDPKSDTNRTGSHIAIATTGHAAKLTLSAGIPDQNENDVQMGDKQINPALVHTASPVTEYTTNLTPSADVQGEVEVTGVDVQIGDKHLPSEQASPDGPPQPSTSAAFQQQGPVTRSRHRQQNPSSYDDTAKRDTAAATASSTLPTEVGGARHVSQTPRMKTRPHITPRQPPRKRPALKRVPLKLQPRRNARKKTRREQEVAHNEIPRIRIPPLHPRLHTTVVVETQTHPSDNPDPQLENARSRAPKVTSYQSHSLRNFEQNLALAVLQDKVEKYQKSLVSMMAEKEYVTEAIATKEEHIKELENLLQEWATATNDKRGKFGEYLSAEAIQATLENQTKLLPQLQGSHNRLFHEIETVRLRLSIAWESITAAEAREKE